MFANKLSVSERTITLKNLFIDFGIPISPSSSLERLIQEEFTHGKISKLTPILAELHQESDASKLANSIGAELKKYTTDTQLIAVGAVLEERLPSLLEIIDIRNSVDRRALLMQQLLQHFHTKLPKTLETDRLHRMLIAAQTNLKSTLDAKIIGQVVEKTGNFCSIRHLKRFGKVLQNVTPALLALEKKDYPLEQKINLSVHALRSLSLELRDTNMNKAANIVDNVHWLAKVALPHLDEKVTIEQALQLLGISLGNVTTKVLLEAGKNTGLSHTEMVQILYASAPAQSLPFSDQELIYSTIQNQRYAAICGFMARIAQDIKQPELEKLSIAGICLASMRQTIVELKTNHLHPENFSESLGTILIGVGTITNNHTLTHVGNSILSGVQAYAGIMAIPGGASVAIPLAVCSVLGKLFLDVPKDNKPNTVQVHDMLNDILRQVIYLQQTMRQEFANLYQVLQAQHEQMILIMEQGFSNLSQLVRYNNAQVLSTLHEFDRKLQDIQAQINQEFTDLYLEYVHDPIEEVDFATRYGGMPVDKMQDSKHKLAMWLLYKSKHPKVIGRANDLEQLPVMCTNLKAADSCLSLINRYVNTSFKQQLPEDLPHLPTWLQAAYAYAKIVTAYPSILGDTDEIIFLTDVCGIGTNIQKFIAGLAQNASFWDNLQQAIHLTSEQTAARWQLLKLQIKEDYMRDMTKMLQTKMPTTMLALSAAAHLQYENFAEISLDVSELWGQELHQHIPQEVFAAIAHNLGRWQIDFVVDRDINTFAELHIPFSSNLLPNHARDVLFRIDVHYRDNKTEELHLLTSTWLAYDLHDPKQRLEQYYKRKFKYGLRHNQYNWISKDGLSNQVEGHAITTTRKIIDHEHVGEIYKEWFTKAVVISEQMVATRLQDNHLFMQQHSSLLQDKKCTQVQNDNILKLRMYLFEQLRTLMQHKRMEYAVLLQNDPILSAGLMKLDVYFTIMTIYTRLLNVPYAQPKKMQTFNSLVTMLQQSENLNADLVTQLDSLFAMPTLHMSIGNEYLDGDFYKKLQAVLARLALLQSNLQIERLRIS